MKIREACLKDAEGMAIVHVESWRSTYKGIISDSVLANLSVETRKSSWLWAFNNPCENENIFVAEDTDGRIVGFADGGRSRNKEFKHEGELYAIYLLKDYQGLGIGKLLLHAVVDSLKYHGYCSMMVWVLNNNPSVGFYHAFGGKVIGQKEITIGEESLVEIALGWDSLTMVV
ncbi:GNAT family N-acetyltransferase [Paenibacillus eucommiae]|uniref:Ribosomal protein S18 acetylase RimI-like enzyme n=1 Tax=Paenibacillus eucommiae TaxID=1355755 RepID=A0ABS4IQH3_9BACL|nr:GNAT family N-acetyltransferase [Paenibacillus eucommiae]MBP1989758.1 ribosomal protein S18 acetylase RimI-like enzyme [Paenibacillus eucommiae]